MALVWAPGSIEWRPLRRLVRACGTFADAALASVASRVAFHAVSRLASDSEGRAILATVAGVVGACQAVKYWRGRHATVDGSSPGNAVKVPAVSAELMPAAKPASLAAAINPPNPLLDMLLILAGHAAGAWLATDCLGLFSSAVEVVPLTGRRRWRVAINAPATPTTDALKDELADLGRRGYVFSPPASHVSQHAASLGQSVLAAARQLVHERHAPDSATATLFDRLFGEGGQRQPAVKVFEWQFGQPPAVLSHELIAVSSHEGQEHGEAGLWGTLCHEFAHTVCRHPEESAARATDGYGRLGPLQLLEAAGYAGFDTCARLLLGAATGAAPDGWGLGAARLLLDAVLARWARFPVSEVKYCRDSSDGELSFNILRELEAEKVACLLLAKCGRDPREYAARWVREGTPIEQVAAGLQTTVKRSSEAALHAITSSDMTKYGTYRWPNCPKISEALLQVLPEAMHIYGMQAAG